MRPPRLRRGDLVGVVSPSGVVTPELEPQLQRGVQTLERLGFEVALSPHARSATLGYSATPEEKAADLHAMFRDPAVKGVICSQGGLTANSCLPLLDWELFRQHPKVFLGLSDITVLLNAIYARTGLITFHGDDVMWGLGRDPSAYDLEELVARLVDGQAGPVRPSGPRETLRAGVAEGPLIGGNIDCLRKLLGTPYLPALDGAILLLESYGFAPEAGTCWFHHLEQAGVLARIGGAVIGHTDGDPPDPPRRLRDVFLEVTRRHDFPVLLLSDFGHNCPNTVLPIGARARLDAGARELVLLEPCVE
jgi:muramoyltetrapeptide carboxypeptidase